MQGRRNGMGEIVMPAKFPKLTNRWGVVMLLFFTRAIMAVHFQFIPPIAPFLINDLSLSYAQLGTLIGLFMLPGFLIALPGGMLGSKFGGRALLLTGSALMALGALLFASSLEWAHPYPVALAGRLMEGTGGVLMNIQISRIVTDWFSGKEITTAMAIQLGGWPLGIAGALATMGSLAVLTSWQAVVHGTAALAGVVFVVVLLFYRDPPAAVNGSAIESGGENYRAASPRIWSIDRREMGLSISAGTVWTIWNCGFLILFSFGPLALVARGWDLAEAGMVISVGSWISIVSVPAGGFLIDRTGRPNLLMGIAIGASTAAILLLPSLDAWESMLLLMIAYGILRGPSAGGINALPSEVLRPNSRSTGFGLYFTTYYVGTGLLPALAGYLRDLSGSADTPVYFAALCTALTALALLVFRLLQHRWSPGKGAH